MSEWVSVKNKLPEVDANVITYSELFGVEIGRLSVGKSWYVNGYPAKNVTHWQLLPDPP
jgi:hypothetical protein